MNVNSKLLFVLLTGAATVVAQAQTDAKPAPAAAIPAANAVQTAKGTDELNLEEVDDSADAAKNKAAVKFVRPAPPDETTTESAVDKLVSPLGVKTDGVQKPAVASATTSSAMKDLFATGMQEETSLVDIVCEDATLADVLRQFRRTTGANIISADSSNLNQRVSVTLNHVPWLDALQAILNTRHFRLEPRGDIYFVSEDKQSIPEFTRSFVLNHASASELATLFNTTLGGMVQDAKGKAIAPAGKAVKPIATAFDGANVVIVTAPEKILADCEAIIKSVDKAIPQIYIEARFIEISNEALHKLGTQWNKLDSWGASVHGVQAGLSTSNDRGVNKSLDFAKSLTGSATSDGTSISSGSGTSGGDRQTSSTSSSSASSSVSRGRTSTDDSVYSSTFSGQLSADDFRLALSAFESMSDVKIFSNPKVIVSNGKEAKVDMTTKFPNVRVQATRNTSNGSDSFDISTQLEVIPGEDKLMFAKEAFYSWGITLSVKPRISPDGLISVEIVPTISQLDSTAATDGTGFFKVSGGDSSAYSSFPVIEVKRLMTDFTMKDGATAVIGGLSKTTEEDIDSGIPYLRKIPYIGPKFFGWKSRGKVQKEIVVFVTLGIADPAELPPDIGLPKNAVTGREYVEGRKLEPGDRDGGIASLMSFDLRPLEEQRRDYNQKPGSVTITPVVKVRPDPVADASAESDEDAIDPVKVMPTPVTPAVAPKAEDKPAPVSKAKDAPVPAPKKVAPAPVVKKDAATSAPAPKKAAPVPAAKKAAATPAPKKAAPVPAAEKKAAPAPKPVAEAPKAKAAPAPVPAAK